MNISLSPSGDFLLTIPSSVVEGEHTVTIPATLAGIAAIKQILRAHEKPADHRIGNISSPTQAQVRAWLAAESDLLEEEREKAKARRAEERRKKLEEETGIDISQIKISI